jgi:hypothetical protein
MTTRKAVAVNNVEAAEVEFAETVKVQNAPMVQRLAATRDMIDQRVKALEAERFEFQTRRDLVRRQAEAVDAGLVIHLEDIEAAIKLLESGLNSVGVSSD